MDESSDEAYLDPLPVRDAGSDPGAVGVEGGALLGQTLVEQENTGTTFICACSVRPTNIRRKDKDLAEINEKML